MYYLVSELSSVVGTFLLLKLDFVLMNQFGTMQAIITQINEKIGATGVVSQECKAVVSQYGQQILDQLRAEVCSFLHSKSMTT